MSEKQQSHAPPVQGAFSSFVRNVIKAVTIGGAALCVGYSFLQGLRHADCPEDFRQPGHHQGKLGAQDASSQKEDDGRMDLVEVDGGGDGQVQSADSVAAHGTGEEDLGLVKDVSKAFECKPVEHVPESREGEKRKIDIISSSVPGSGIENTTDIKRQRLEKSQHWQRSAAGPQDALLLSPSHHLW